MNKVEFKANFFWNLQVPLLYNSFPCPPSVSLSESESLRFYPYSFRLHKTLSFFNRHFVLHYTVHLCFFALAIDGVGKIEVCVIVYVLGSIMSEKSYFLFASFVVTFLVSGYFSSPLFVSDCTARGRTLYVVLFLCSVYFLLFTYASLVTTLICCILSISFFQLVATVSFLLHLYLFSYWTPNYRAPYVTVWHRA